MAFLIRQYESRHVIWEGRPYSTNGDVSKRKTMANYEAS